MHVSKTDSRNANKNSLRERAQHMSDLSREEPVYNLRRFQKEIQQKGIRLFARSAIVTLTDEVLPALEEYSPEEYSFDIVKAIVAQIRPNHFYKVVVSDRNPNEFLDVYRFVFKGVPLYIKFIIRPRGRYVLSCKIDTSA